MPNGNTWKMARPLLEQMIVCCLVTVDDIWNERPVEAWVAVPVIYPARVSIHVEQATLPPNCECPVVEHKRLADLGHDSNIVLARKRYQGMSAS